ncbi:hypothetical protein LIA77_05824 [Sarocladium implicatum]|nr:hypothetical protein LIA77_05824 [Sarocladium implicatum]
MSNTEEAPRPGAATCPPPGKDSKGQQLPPCVKCGETMGHRRNCSHKYRSCWNYGIKKRPEDASDQGEGSKSDRRACNFNLTSANEGQAVNIETGSGREHGLKKPWLLAGDLCQSEEVDKLQKGILAIARFRRSQNGREIITRMRWQEQEWIDEARSERL